MGALRQQFQQLQVRELERLGEQQQRVLQLRRGPRIRQAKLSQSRFRNQVLHEGVNVRPAKGNVYADADSRTLNAWREVIVIRVS